MRRPSAPGPFRNVALSACSLVLGLAPGLAGCGPRVPLGPLPQPREQSPATWPQATSLLGRALYTPTLAADRRARLEEELETARAQWLANPEDEEAWIWYGRRLAYLGRYRDAIGVYTRGLAVHPDSARLLRHRGHRWITVRELDRAVADLERARELVADLPDEVEPDGAPNASGIPRSTLESNIGYHLGLAHFVRGDFERACVVYEDCLEVSRVNDDMLVATSYWLVLSLRRVGLDARADEVLQPISMEMEILENDAYRDLLLLFRGELSPQEVLSPAVPEGGSVPGLELATRGFGVACHWQAVGEPERAWELLQRVVDETAWPAFGHLASEAELRRNPPPPPVEEPAAGYPGAQGQDQAARPRG